MSYLIDTEPGTQRAQASPVKLAVELAACRGQLRKAQRSSYFPLCDKWSGEVRMSEFRIEAARKEVWRGRG